ncbi:hypothetical protein Ndes2437B_g06713 [Nannochloris sp. 'desiccata']|nr:hypothetical protein KSW81_003991 [Chlorella desiccata (nom. nud.)]
MGLFSRLPAGAKAIKPRLYQAIDRATSEYLSAPNLAQNMDVVSTINGAVDPTYAANKACKRICLRLRTRNQRVQYVALQLLENCMRACGETFHNELARSDLFTGELARMADRSIWCATEIQRLVLALIQEWAYEINIPAYSALFNRLKQRGLPFGPRGAPTDQVFQPYPGLSPPSPAAAAAGGVASPGAAGLGGVLGGGGGAGSPHHPGNARHRHRPSPHQQGHQENGHGGGGRGAVNLGPNLLRPGRSTPELQSDLETARGSIALLNEVLDGAEKEANYAAVKEEYCVEVVGACEAIKERVAGLLGSGNSDEGVVAAAIEVNDDAQRALDRRLALMEVADGRRAPPVVVGPGAGAATAGAAAAAAAAASTAAATVSSPAAANAATTTAPAAPANLMDLLDLDWTPAAEPGSKAADPFLPPAPMVPPPMNNPFAAGNSGGGGGGGSAEAPIPSSSTKDSTAKEPSPKVSSPVASPSAAGGGEKSKPKLNPFLSDDAFSQLSLSREPSTVSVPPPSPSAATTTTTTANATTVPTPSAAVSGPPALSSRPSGNPFAAAAPGPADANSRPAASAFNRPPSLVIPGHDPTAAGFVPTPGPYTAPAAAGGGADFGAGHAPGPASKGTEMVGSSSAYQAFHAPLPTAGAVPYRHQQQQHYSAQQFPSTGAPGAAGAGGFGGPSPFVPTPQHHQGFGAATPGMYGTNQMPGQPPVADSFKDLVVLKPQKEEVPPPKKGSPMRRGSTPKIGAGINSAEGNGNGGGSFSPRPEVTAAPVATAETGTAPAASALSAFDAFDALASGR